MLTTITPLIPYILVLAGILFAFILVFIYKREIIRKWLLEAVTKAENEIGGGQGALKLKLVHTWLIQAFPIVGRILPFQVFSELVDAALEIMREQLNNKEED